MVEVVMVEEGKEGVSMLRQEVVALVLVEEEN